MTQLHCARCLPQETVSASQPYELCFWKLVNFRLQRQKTDWLLLLINWSGKQEFDCGFLACDFLMYISLNADVWLWFTLFLPSYQWMCLFNCSVFCIWPYCQLLFSTDRGNMFDAYSLIQYIFLSLLLTIWKMSSFIKFEEYTFLDL